MGSQRKITNNNQATAEVNIINLYSKKLVATSQNDNEKYLFSPVTVSVKPNSNEFLLSGFYYDKNGNFLDGLDKGIAVYTLSGNGKVINKTYNSWSEDLAKYLKIDGKGKIEKVGNFLFQKVVNTNDSKV